MISCLKISGNGQSILKTSDTKHLQRLMWNAAKMHEDPCSELQPSQQMQAYDSVKQLLFSKNGLSSRNLAVHILSSVKTQKKILKLHRI